MEGRQVTLANENVALKKKMCDDLRTIIVNNEAKLVYNDENVKHLDEKSIKTWRRKNMDKEERAKNKELNYEARDKNINRTEDEKVFTGS